MRARTLILLSTLLSAGVAHAGGLQLDHRSMPSGASVQTNGQSAVVFQNPGNHNAIINWTTFNLGRNDSVTFKQPDSSYAVLNRVTGGFGPSWINGTISAVGSVFIVNRDGIIFGPHATIRTGNFLATTSDILNYDFRHRQYNFTIPGRTDASISNRGGTITASTGGFAALVAPNVRNSGTITATLGTVALGAGNIFNLDFYGDRLIALNVSEETARRLTEDSRGGHGLSVTNNGVLSANGGRVELTAATARGIVNSVINNTGVIEANSVRSRNGEIVLSANTVNVGGTLSAAGVRSGQKGGKIAITGNNIHLHDATVDASGHDGGGRVTIAALREKNWDWGDRYDPYRRTSVSVDGQSSIDVSATARRNGGTVTIASTDRLTFLGGILALGGKQAGDRGGSVTLWSGGVMHFGGTSDTRAANGPTGSLQLIAPRFLVADNATIEGPRYTSWLTGSTLSSLLAANNVTLVAAARRRGDITVDAPVTWGTAEGANALTLAATHNIALNAQITTSTGMLTLDAGRKITATEAVNVGTFRLLHGFWKQVGPLPGFSANDFQLAGGHFLRAADGNGATDPYQIADIYGLQGIGTLHRARSFTLIDSIDASGTANWNNGTGFVPIGDLRSPFRGTFDGNNKTIRDLTVGGTSVVGLFGVIGKNAKVGDLILENITVAGVSRENGLSAVGVLAGWNRGTIDGVSITGINTIVFDGNGAVGGLVGFNTGTISNANTDVLVVANGDLIAAGGLAGLNGRHGVITTSQAHGAVAFNQRFPSSIAAAGGLVGVNAGAITQTFATGAVTGGDNGWVGGLVGLSNGAIAQSYATGATSGGANAFVAGLVAQNAGTIDQTYAIGRVTGTAGKTGGLVATNSLFVGPLRPSGENVVLTNSVALADSVNSLTLSVPGGTTTNSYWNVETTGQTQSAGGTPMTTTQLSSGVPPGFDQTVWVTPAPSSPGAPVYPCLAGQCAAGAPNPTPNVNPNPPTNPNPAPSSDSGTPVGTTPPSTTPPPSNTSHDSQVALANSIITNILNGPPPSGDLYTVQLGNPGLGGTAGIGGTPGGSSAGGTTGSTDGSNSGDRPPQDFVPGPGPGPLPSGMPPVNETRFVSNEVVVQLGSAIPPEKIAELEKEFGLEVISMTKYDVLGRTVYRFRITGDHPLRLVIVAFELLGNTVSAQPSYNFEMAHDATMAGASRQDNSTQQVDSSQYVVAKLGLIQAHTIATGKDVKIAVIDSEIDAKHPDLVGTIAQTFDALPSSDQKPHPHGTGMAGAISSHQRLMGIAPAAQILGIRAFGASDAGAQGTSINIVKGLEWAVAQGAQVINMSFAGPRDPILEQAIKSLKQRGIILVGAAGNAGPKSPPLFPGADPNVIGVSATDLDDKTFKGANRGKQVAIAAPGVDVIVPAPEGGYQLTTGTSVAAAEISGVIALMLERNPKLTPDDVRNILMATAKKLPQGHLEVGAGLVDPVQALAKSGPKQAKLTR